MELIIGASYVKGQINAPPSKSMTQRAIAAASLADGRSTILNPSYCNDSMAAMKIAAGLGASLNAEGDVIRIQGFRRIKEKVLNCGESGLAVRMFTPIASLYPDEIIMTGSGSLVRRPMFIIGDALSQLGVKCISNDGYLPLSVQGPLRSGRCAIDGSLSSQVLTGLLMALPLAPGTSKVRVSNLKSKPYIDMTTQVLGEFGIEIINNNYSEFIIEGGQKYNAREYEVEGDWSGGAFLLAAGAINGNVVVTGLRKDSLQSDKAIIEALTKAGAGMTVNDRSIAISKSSLKPFEFDATESPDLFPPLTALAAYCHGTTEIKGAARLIHKESNRADALISEFGKMNIGIELKGDSLFIRGGDIRGATIDSHNDHRIAMAAAIAALGSSGGIRIKGSECVAKSYPDFFKDMRKAGALVSE